MERLLWILIKFIICFLVQQIQQKFVLQFLSEQISPNYKNINLTSRDTNLDDVSLAENDLVFLGVPSYAGRVPITFKERFSKIKGNNALAIVVVTYGNRAQEDTFNRII